MDWFLACYSLLEGTMTRNRTTVWDLNYVTVIMSPTTKSTQNPIPARTCHGPDLIWTCRGPRLQRGGEPRPLGRKHHLDDPRTPKQRGRATNARRRAGADQQPMRAGETSPEKAGTDAHTATSGLTR